MPTLFQAKHFYKTCRFIITLKVHIQAPYIDFNPTNNSTNNYIIDAPLTIDGIYLFLLNDEETEKELVYISLVMLIIRRGYVYHGRHGGKASNLRLYLTVSINPPSTSLYYAWEVGIRANWLTIYKSKKNKMKYKNQNIVLILNYSEEYFIMNCYLKYKFEEEHFSSLRNIKTSFCLLKK